MRRTGMAASAQPNNASKANHKTTLPTTGVEADKSPVPLDTTTPTTFGDPDQGTSEDSSTSVSQDSTPGQRKSPARSPTSEPLTVSLDKTLIRRIKVIAACRGTTTSKILASLVATAVERELPAVLAELQGDNTGASGGDR